MRSHNVWEFRIRGINGVPIQQIAFNRATGAVNCQPTSDDRTSGGTVDKAVKCLAEVKENKGVIVHVAREHLTSEFAFLEAHTGERRYTFRRSEDAGQRMQAVDSHIIERPAARFAEVPCRIDIGERIVTMSDRFVFVVSSEGRTRGCPRQRPDGTFGNKAANFLMDWTEHLARGRH